MEKRLSRFIKNRRSRLSEPAHEKPTSHTTLTSSSPLPSPKKPMFFASQLRVQNASTSELGDSDAASDSLRSFAYDSCAVGRPPTFVTKAQPGNGPVKLQASRRLSTGELIATTQEGALKDIRDGDYVVGRKERPASRGPRKSTIRSPTIATFGQSIPTDPASTTPASPRTWSGMAFAESSRSMPCILDENITSDADFDQLGLGLISSATANQSRFSRTSRTGLRHSGSQPSLSRESIKSYRISSGQDASATLIALKKAEFSRMADLYGPEAAAIKLARTSSNPSSPLLQFSPTLENSPTFDGDLKEQNSDRASRLSETSASCYDESLEARSLERTSYISSHAGSNATAPTSFSDEECTTSREDIKSMVEQIRSTYLDAFDDHTAPPQATKSRKKKKKTKSTSSSVVGGPERTRPKAPVGRQTWHPQSQLPEISSKRRVNSHPVNAVGRLPPIPASPTRDLEDDLGIKRADSTTLGEIMADMTRASIRAQRISKQAEEPTKRNFSRPTTPKSQTHKAKESWLSLDSDAIESPLKEPSPNRSRLLEQSSMVSTISPRDTQFDTLSTQSRDDFEELYQDLFGKDVDTLWSSSTLFSEKGSSLLITHTTNPMEPPIQFSTPRKPPRITSIPESPEYTHLADPCCPEGRFI